jgi:hypothetical protein
VGNHVQNYQVKHETITINENDYLIRSLKDRQQFYDHKQQAAALGISSATWSLFGVVWPASQILAATVSMIELEGKRVLEIGCGIALPKNFWMRTCYPTNYRQSSFKPVTGKRRIHYSENMI